MFSKRLVAWTIVFVFAAIISSCICQAAFADITLKELLKKIEKLEEENKKLKEEQEQENAKFRKELEAIRNELTRVTGEEIEPCAPEEADDYTPASVFCKFPIRLYGFFKGDMIYNDSQVGEWGAAAPSEGSGDDDNEFLMAVRWSRIGLKTEGLELPGGGKAEAAIEMDFVNVNPTQGDADRHPAIRLYQAYAHLKYRDWDLLAGQVWDFFSPLNPNMINAAWLERGGNIGYRHPELRFTYRFRDVFGGMLTTQAGILDTTLFQNDSGYPISAGYAYYERDIMGMPFYLGIGGIYGQERISNNITGYVDVWAATTAFKFQPLDKLSFSGEGFIGQDLQDFWGGSSMGVVTYPDGTGKAVRSRGGWVQATYTPIEKIQINAGAGIDDVMMAGGNGNLPIWDYNYSIFTNFKYELVSDLWWAIEYQYFKTKYLQQPGGDANRMQSSIIYRF